MHFVFYTLPSSFLSLSVIRNLRVEQLSEFTCGGDDDFTGDYYACLRSCYRYPKTNFSSANCPDGFSYITCGKRVTGCVCMCVSCHGN